ncbi:asparagine synthase (glutamine-hydrolyzing) [Bizionia argentinensis JUB59]|uniref:asparagine synthase (glutamine-hydrolyzing) n=1 Tax=Bizionia argentinensis JUB59 TaxID=1046627 RepID=G2E9B1_9FLAO|nr:asparagine synthase (glutamine-hydrolyzing) [Bizionia argentinensis]EGV45046.1 asparagine synthase (glutamine-hydrolyzing) [Bizionia argentinensis JUB59]
MCGINGFIKSSHLLSEDTLSILNEMNQVIIHRGPDDSGFYYNNSDTFTVAMAMRRLSIIDLTTGHQPISNESDSITIVFNGEIYNYRKLRADLETQGHTFKTKSDTEVVLKLYEIEGEKSFKKLDGMFAFSIHDSLKKKLIIARDFFGEKPLYYTKTDNSFFYASELKSIINVLQHKPKISKIGLNLFFKLTYIPAPFSIYENIYKLEANHYITYNLEDHSTIITEINSLKAEKSNLSFNTAKAKLNDLMMTSIESRSISDVPIGTFLSGGVDSSIVSLGLSQLSSTKIDTFSIGFDKAVFDETDKSKLVAKLINSNHHEFIISENDIKEHINAILLNFDEPFADSSALPTYLVSKKTSDFVKVALTGDGGDEVFGGYNKYYMGNLNNRYIKTVPEFLHNSTKPILLSLLSTKDDNRGKRFKLKKILQAIDYSGDNYWNIISLGFANDSGQLLNLEHSIDNPFTHYKAHISKPNSLHDYREIDRLVSLEGDMLVKVDRTSMMNSLECRAPFLNKTLWDFANSLPENYLLKGWSKKHILKEAFKHKFPQGFLEKSKKGFIVPVGDWLRSSLKSELKSYIDSKLLSKQNIFNSNYIRPLVLNHLSGKEDNSYKVWAFYTFQKWYFNIYNS